MNLTLCVIAGLLFVVCRELRRIRHLIALALTSPAVELWEEILAEHGNRIRARHTKREYNDRNETFTNRTRVRQELRDDPDRLAKAERCWKALDEKLEHGRFAAKAWRLASLVPDVLRRW
jgi:hypothetical protein